MTRDPVIHSILLASLAWKTNTHGSLPFYISYLAALFGNSVLILSSTLNAACMNPCTSSSVLAGLTSSCLLPLCPRLWPYAGFTLEQFPSMAVPLRSSSFTATFIAESGTLLSTAFDRYVTAICDPLCDYDTKLSHVVAARIGLAVGLRRFCGILPDMFPVKWLSFCHSSVLPHTY